MARGSAIEKHGAWFAVYRQPGEDGKKGKVKWDRVGSSKRHDPDYCTKQAVYDHLAKVCVDIKEGSYMTKADVPFQNYAASFLKAHGENIKPSTLKKYECHLRYKITPYFKNRKLRTIRPTDIKNFMAQVKDEGMSVQNRRKYLTTLKLVLKTACQDELITRNPAQYISPPKIQDEDKTQLYFLSPSEMNLLVKHTDERHRIFIIFACRTGLRQAEQLFLQWDDIDLVNGYVLVRPNSLRGLKSASSNRRVPLEPDLLEALKIHKLTQMQALKAGQNQDNLVFTSTTGTALNPSNLDRRILGPALTRGGLPKCRWHDLRHSYATALLSAGEPIAYVSKKLGHANPAITLKVYAHSLKENEDNEHARHGTIFGLITCPEKALC